MIFPASASFQSNTENMNMVCHPFLHERGKKTKTREVWRQSHGWPYRWGSCLGLDKRRLVRFLESQDTWTISSPPLQAHPIHCWTLHTVPTWFHDERCPLWVLQLMWTVVRQHQNVGIQSWWEKSYLFSKCPRLYGSDLLGKLSQESSTVSA